MARIQIYTTAICPYCLAAKQFLLGRGLDYDEVRVDADRQRRAEMTQISGRTSVPQIFVDGKSIGGYDDMVALDRAGEFDALLASES